MSITERAETSERWDGLVLRAPKMDDPWAWLAAGWRDTWRSPLVSLGYGAAFVAAGLLLTFGLVEAGLESVVPVVAAGFVLVGPVLAIGLYDISRRHAAGLPVRLRDLPAIRLPAPMQLAYFSFCLMFLFLLWLRLATLNYALFSYGSHAPLDEFVRFALTTQAGIAMFVVGSLIGGAIALLVFAISAVSVPILMQYRVDFLTAMAISLRTVQRHPGPMLLWAWLVALLTAFGIATLFVGLIVVFPLVGHATWHACRTLVAGEADQAS